MSKTVKIAAVVLAAGLLFYALRGTDWHRVGQLLAQADRRRLAAVTALGIINLALRAARWRLLLTAERPVQFGTAFRATAAGYFGNNFLPARAGEVVRTLIVSAETGLEKSFVLATALSERAADAIALVVIASIVLPTLKSVPSWLPAALQTGTIVGAGAGLAMALAPRFEAAVRAVIQRLPVTSGARCIVERIAGNALGALRIFGNPARLGKFAGMTACIWTLDAAGAMLTARALGLLLPLNGAYLLLAGLGLGSALPSAPGYAGIYQFVAVTILGPFGFSRADAIAYILLVQALSWVVILCCYLPVTAGRMGGRKRRQDQPAAA